ncbi:unnamed protein product [Thelazia callipaeda]|uniref:Uncharacterized protein n=1 Tax=Thelazia callipaeda TaxID=103827 RepID=A0A0N5D9L2_THECL|nr:unnamed protein product [Thelazia callipaeda]
MDWREVPGISESHEVTNVNTNEKQISKVYRSNKSQRRMECAIKQRTGSQHTSSSPGLIIPNIPMDSIASDIDIIESDTTETSITGSETTSADNIPIPIRHEVEI